MPIIRRRSDLGKAMQDLKETLKEGLDRPEHPKEQSSANRRYIYRNKPEVDDLVTRVAYGGMRVPMTAAEWDLWCKYVQVV